VRLFQNISKFSFPTLYLLMFTFVSMHSGENFPSKLVGIHEFTKSWRPSIFVGFERLTHHCFCSPIQDNSHHFDAKIMPHYFTYRVVRGCSEGSWHNWILRQNSKVVERGIRKRQAENILIKFSTLTSPKFIWRKLGIKRSKLFRLHFSALWMNFSVMA